MNRVSPNDRVDVLAHNRRAWDRNVDQGNRWTCPVDREQIARARSGQFSIVLTPTKPVPADWFPSLQGLPTLGLAAAGGQQSPILAAAGAEVTVLDNSAKQLAQDAAVAKREGLALRVEHGDMADLSRFADESFGLIFHPCSNCFAQEVRTVWRECFRVLRPGGVLLSGFSNPVRYLFEDERVENGNLAVRYQIPYSDLDHLEDPAIRARVDAGLALEFGHTLDDQLGGQLAAGLIVTGFYEDRYDSADGDPISEYLATFIATRAVKP